MDGIEGPTTKAFCNPPFWKSLESLGPVKYDSLNYGGIITGKNAENTRDGTLNFLVIEGDYILGQCRVVRKIIYKKEYQTLPKCKNCVYDNRKNKGGRKASAQESRVM